MLAGLVLLVELPDRLTREYVLGKEELRTETSEWLQLRMPPHLKDTKQAS